MTQTGTKAGKLSTVDRRSAPLARLVDGRPRWLPIGGLAADELAYQEAPELEMLWRSAQVTMRGENDARNHTG